MNEATTSLLTEHFSYTPLVNDIINSINNLIYQGISSLESGLITTPPERLGFAHATNGSTIPDTDDDGNVVYPEARLEIENGLHQLETLLESTVDKSFDKFEIYVLRNIFTVPEDLTGWVRLAHYENLALGEASSNAPTPETILTQRKKLHETRKLNRSLKQEVARNDAMIAQLRAILGSAQGSGGETEAPPAGDSATRPDLDLSFLTSSPAARQLRVGAAAGPNTTHTPLTTSTAFILSQLPALQEMLKRLRSKLSSLPKSDVSTAADSKREERKAYIESRIRLHLERAGQLAVGSDGQPLLTGRKIALSEAQALEAVSGLLTEDTKME
ncbi:hypothetical protein ASPZODRAFT_68712 [Penicilliopsis zonata CBS 506.65]|uniref:MIND kinetochore complex component Mtw1 n=1 Tax=Penicilliopsis zonata CBS 506.65 TaxID=1073090 RepID=A0A1L9SF66_9EURO|nr:hypothetical protein ASPZODRAFT_68712 [Penicilliopsis zonata CBS 506.65]OJJ45753.1 hypothetical protein ASPZODRAFT_68712 [Penicilliopsis zonata CBS 506.65]